jgi:hypothetical protein
MEKALTKQSTGGGALSTLGFSDHTTFQMNVGRSVLGASAGALIADMAARMVAGTGTAPFSAVVIGLATGALAAVASRGGRGWLSAAMGGALGLAGGILHTLSTPAFPWFGALLLGFAAAPVLARGESPTKMAVTGAMTGCLAYFGLYVASVLQAKGILGSVVPGPLATALAGGAAGLFLGLGATPKHLAAKKDPVELAYKRALMVKDTEIHEILERSMRLYLMVRDDLAARATTGTERELRGRVSELAMRILHIAHQCRTIQSDLGAAPASELEERIDNLRSKAAATSDKAARATFLATVESLEAQKASVDSIARGLERVLARLHANVALLDKVRFSLVHARSASAELMGGDASPLIDTIDELSKELDATSQAVGEVFGADSDPTSVSMTIEGDMAKVMLDSGEEPEL